uniref:Uncharacterized protein n=1 Tax=Plectus sambesii TaxID=2011161 RepID=A0A914WJF4_9BILA
MFWGDDEANGRTMQTAKLLLASLTQRPPYVCHGGSVRSRSIGPLPRATSTEPTLLSDVQLGSIRRPYVLRAAAFGLSGLKPLSMLLNDKVRMAHWKMGSLLVIMQASR